MLIWKIPTEAACAEGFLLIYVWLLRSRLPFNLSLINHFCDMSGVCQAPLSLFVGKRLNCVITIVIKLFSFDIPRSP